MRTIKLKVKNDCGIFNPELKEVLGKEIIVHAFVVINNYINAILEPEYFNPEFDYTVLDSSDWIPLSYFVLDHETEEQVKQCILENVEGARGRR